MPYITKKARYLLDTGQRRPETAGELNYAITKLTNDYLGSDSSYAGINSAIGALECAKLELYRRVAAPYEDTKSFENGDVYYPRTHVAEVTQ